MMNELRATELLSKAFQCKPVETDEAYEFVLSKRIGDLKVSITKAVLSSTVKELNAKSRYNSLWLHDDKSMEILAREENRIPVRLLRGDKLKLRDDENGVNYESTDASDVYILFFLDAISEHSDARLFLRNYMSSSQLERLMEREEQLTVFELIRIAFLRITTVRITCDAKTSPLRMQSLANAFLFQMAFNTDIALVPQKEIDAISRSSRISLMRRNRTSEIDPPRRTYDEDLIHHYLMAISTDNPFVEYLSHYHVLEHFYEAVFQDNLITSIQTQITSPAFSYHREKDIKELIKTIKKSLKFQNDTITFSEENALFLTLMKFVDVSDLLDDLDNYDPNIVDYFRNTEVIFAKANKVDLRSDKNSAYKSLSKRIYKTRNALVHSKDNEKAKYTPFVDDHILAKELPLLRFLAERTILKNSEMIK